MLNRRKYNYLLIYNLLKIFFNLNTRNKLIILIFFDILIICFSIFLVFIFLKYDFINSLNFFILTKLFFCIFSSTILFKLTGQYNSLSRYINTSEIFLITIRNFLILPLLYIFSIFINISNFGLTPYFLFWIINSYFVIISRFGLKEITNFCDKVKANKINIVAIYGAGAAGAQLASTLSLNGNYSIIAFFDDSKMLHGRSLLGIPILSSNKISKFKGKISQILFAIPSLDL